jgi:hypothetical protein
MNMPVTRVPGTRVPIVVALAALRALLAVVLLVAGAGPVVGKIARFDTRAKTFKAYMGSHTGRLGVIE